MKGMIGSPVYISKKSMEKEERFQKNWLLMFEKDNLDEFIRRNSEKMVTDYMDGKGWFHSNCMYDRGYYDQELVGDVWCDMLSRCQNDSVPITAFDRIKLFALLKGRGFSQKNLSRNRSGITLRLPNGAYKFDTKVNNNQVIVDNRFSCGSSAKVTSIGEEGFIEFMSRFDSAIPEIRKGMDEGYRKMKVLCETEQKRRKKLKQMVEIATKNRGIDYSIEFEGDSLKLKFERIVYSKIEETITEDELAEFLKALPEKMSETIPKVTAGKETSFEMIPITYSPPQPRDSVYKSLVKGTKEDIIKR